MQRTRIISVDPASTVSGSRGKLRRMPRKLKHEVRALVVSLIAQEQDAPEIIAAVARQFPGESVSRNTITNLRGKVGMPSKPGRREGSEHADTIAELSLYEPPLSLREMAAITGLSAERIRQLKPVAD